ncbi:DMT family transporter [Halalkalicoccus subterraneus]|uniref:DMT family transporter n=1 Tax=Halalkalicoccus subterraneus TaxID=2675002 RepID=UPI000EFD7BCD|nr:EamA family transporter [Halalkalicoccus subterraneus]
MQFENISKFREVALFIVVALVWGASFPAINLGLESLPPILFAALRYDVAAVLVFAFVALKGLAWRPTSYEDWLLIVIGGSLLIAGHFALLFTGQQYVTGGVASIVLSLSPIVTPVFAIAFLPNQRLGVMDVLGLAFGLLGVGIIAQPGSTALGGGQLYGIALLVASATSFALGAVLTARLQTTLSLVSLQAWMMLVGATLLHLTSALHPGESLAAASWTPEALAAIAFLAVFASAIGYLAYFDLQDRVGPVETSLVNYASPVVATVSGWALLGEPVTDATMLGFAVIAFGFWLCKWSAFTWKVTGLTGRIRHYRAARSPDLVVVGTSVYHRDR